MSTAHKVAPAPAITSSAARPPDRKARTVELFAAIGLATSDHEEARLLDEVTQINMGVARAIAGRYRNRGVAPEDLEQVAFLGLIKAVRGYDPESGYDFLSYAVPTISGEVKRHFRDFAWAVRPPRRVQELHALIPTATAELTFTLGRSPRPSELAERLGESLDDVREALTTEDCFSPCSLDRSAGIEGDTTIGDLLGVEELGARAAEARLVLGPAVRRLRERDRHIVMLRFFSSWTQQEIADDIGVTQMQVSRLLSRILTELRRDVGTLDDVG